MNELRQGLLDAYTGIIQAMTGDKLEATRKLTRPIQHSSSPAQLQALAGDIQIAVGFVIQIAQVC